MPYDSAELGVTWWWISFDLIKQQIPLLDCSLSTLKRHVNNLVNAKLLIRHEDNRISKKAKYSQGINFNNLVYTPEKRLPSPPPVVAADTLTAAVNVSPDVAIGGDSSALSGSKMDYKNELEVQKWTTERCKNELLSGSKLVHNNNIPYNNTHNIKTLSLSEIKNFLKERSLNLVPAEVFFNYYESRGWRNICNWHKLAELWQARAEIEQKEKSCGKKENAPRRAAPKGSNIVNVQGIKIDTQKECYSYFEVSTLVSSGIARMEDFKREVSPTCGAYWVRNLPTPPSSPPPPPVAVPGAISLQPLTEPSGELCEPTQEEIKQAFIELDNRLKVK